jgi:integrase
MSKNPTLKITELHHKNGSTYYRLYLGTINGKMKYRQFKSRVDAETFQYQASVEQQANVYKESIGDLGELMSVRYEALNCLHRLKAVGATFTDAIDYYLKYAKPINGAMTIKDACDAFIKLKTTSNRSTKYLRGLRTHDFKSFQDHFGTDTKIGDVTSSMFNDYLYAKTSWNATSKLSHIRFISVLFNYCLREGYVTANPIKKIERPQQENKAPCILGIGETQKMLNLALKKDFKDVVALMTLVLFCGVRVEEASKLRWSDFEWKTFIVNVSEKIAKKRRHRYNEIPGNAKEWLMWARPDDYYTSNEPIIKGDWKGKLSRLREELKMTYGQNSMRHSFASFHIAKFGDPARTCLMLGHVGDYNTLYSHYRNAVTKADAERFFNIYPKELKRKGGNITVQQLREKYADKVVTE